MRTAYKYTWAPRDGRRTSEQRYRGGVPCGCGRPTGVNIGRRCQKAPWVSQVAHAACLSSLSAPLPNQAMPSVHHSGRRQCSLPQSGAALAKCLIGLFLSKSSRFPCICPHHDRGRLSVACACSMPAREVHSVVMVGKGRRVSCLPPHVPRPNCP
jgi:hypothetical protein